MEEKEKATPTTQGRQVLAHLQTHRGITSLKAFQLYNITRLSAIIFNLKIKYAIGDRWIEVVDDEGNKTRFKEYYLMEEGDFVGD